MNNNSSKKMESPVLIVRDKVLICRNLIIQISSITKCEVGPEPPEPYPIWLIIALITGGLLVFNEDFRTIGFFILIFFGFFFFIIFNANSNLETYFILELNSGSTLLFSSPDKDFLLNAENEIIKCFNDKKGDCIINFSDCTIQQSQIGKNNFMNKSEG